MRAADLDLLSRSLVFFSGAMAALMLWMVYTVFASEPVPVRPAPPDERPACDLSRVGVDPCPDGQICLNQTCTPFAAEAETCDEGESCRDCECSAGLVCHHLRCRAPDKLPPAPLECRKNPALRDAVRKLRRECEALNEHTQGARERGCSGEDWKQIALRDENFDTILTNFEHRITVHFEPGAPLKSGRLRDVQQREYYLEQLRPMREALLQAKQIFVIGRSSPDGAVKDNYDLALRRIDMVASLLYEVVYPDVPPSGRPRLPIQQWGMPIRSDGRDLLISPRFFKDRYVSPAVTADFGISPLFGWDAASSRRLREFVGSTDPALAAAHGEDAWLVSALNRVVLVVPIPCDGEEFIPVVTPIFTSDAGR